jgi:hypothetical protein
MFQCASVSPESNPGSMIRSTRGSVSKTWSVRREGPERSAIVPRYRKPSSALGGPSTFQVPFAFGFRKIGMSAGCPVKGGFGGVVSRLE